MHFRKTKVICKYERDKYYGLKPPPFLAKFLDMLILFHGENTLLIVQELKSLPGCEVQLQHSDCTLYEVSKKRRAFADIPFSVLVALENNTNSTTIINENNHSLIVFQGDFAMWRGDYEHAGASYSVINTRLFIAVIDKQEANRFKYVTF